MRANAKILIILNSIESLFTAWAFMKAGRMEPGNILVGVVFMLAFFLYRNIKGQIVQYQFLLHIRSPRR